MQLRTIFLIVVLFVIFSLTGYFLVNRYFSDHWDIDRYFTNNKDSQQIIFSEENNLFSVPSDINDSTKSLKTRIQSTGKVVSLIYNRKASLIYYESINTNLKSDIWQIDLNNNKSQLLFSSETLGLENFLEFVSPVLSPNKTRLAFVGKLGTKDCLFTYLIASQELTNLSDKIYNEQIKNPQWLSDNEIVFQKDNSLYLMDLITGKISDYFMNDKEILKIAATTDKLILLLKSDQDSNIYAYNGKNLEKITDFASPKTVNNFDISHDETVIALEIKNSISSVSDLYMAKINGQDLTELTENMDIAYPVFSPSNDRIAVFNKKQGLVLIDIKTKKQQKILNETRIDQIFLWR